jgi:threonine-phosphate decarboxylase
LSVSAEQIECGAGAADLIWRLGLAVKPKSAAVTAPTFSEYAAAMSASGCEVFRHDLPERDGFNVTERLLDGLNSDALFICNPNNPTSLTVEPSLMLKIADYCRERGILLVVDECFNAFLDEPELHSLIRRVDEYPNLLILRAFTKLYGMAGVRLGFCVSSDTDLLSRIAASGQPWAVSGAAQAAGVSALAEREYVAATMAVIREGKSYLTSELEKLGHTVLGCEANYIFFKTKDTQLAEKLLEKGVMLRECSGYEGLGAGYYRIAARTMEDNRQLIERMKN